jgi:hypothetical protein
MRSCTAPPPFLGVTKRRRLCYEAVSRHLRTLYTQFIYRVQPKNTRDMSVHHLLRPDGLRLIPSAVNTRAITLPSTRQTPAPQCSSVPLAISWTTSAAAFIAAECATTMIVLLERSLCSRMTSKTRSPLPSTQHAEPAVTVTITAALNTGRTDPHTPKLLRRNKCQPPLSLKPHVILTCRARR